MESLNSLGTSLGVSPSVLQWLVPLIGILAISLVIIYIYGALTTQVIAKRLNHPNPWLAWIPIANIVLLWQISGLPQWTLILYFVGLGLTFVPFINSLSGLLEIAMVIYMWWVVCEKLHRPGWWSIFAIVFFPAWLVLLGIMAWTDAPAAPASSTPTAPAPQA